MNRRFVNLVLDTYDSAIPLCRINLSRFFYPKKRNGGAGVSPQPTVEEDSLPKPVMSFSVSYSKNDGGITDFMPLARNTNKVVGLYEDGSGMLYDAEMNSLRLMPRLNWPKRRTIPVSVGQNLYLIEETTLQCDLYGFEVLKYDATTVFDHRCWYWQPHCPPPYVMVPSYVHANIRSCTVVGDSSIWITTEGEGTYSFDTVSSVWSKVGSWELPFQGRAMYTPEHGIWFGFSSVDAVFCASYLVGPRASLPVPTLCSFWKEELAFPDEWKLVTSRLLHVGSAKFCIARFFEVWNQHEDPEERYVIESFVVFTGVEVELRSSADNVLQLVKHKSVRYSLANSMVRRLWIF